MKLSLILSVCAGLLLSGVVHSDPPEWNPEQFYPAAVFKGFDCRVFWLEKSGQATPWIPGSGLGMVMAVVNQAVVVVDTSHKFPVEDLLWSCKGKLPFGEPTIAYDAWTGEELEVMLATPQEVCAAAPGDACHGKNAQGALTWTGDNIPATCDVWTPTGWLITSDWTRIVAPSGQTQLKCHFRGE